MIRDRSREHPTCREHLSPGAAVRPRRRRRPALVLAVGLATVLAGCSSGSTSGATGPGAGTSTSGAPTTVAPTTTTTVPPTTTTTTAPEQPGWTTLSVGPHGIAIDQRVYPQPDGTQVVVARFLANHVDYNFHVGSQEPPSGSERLH